MEPDLDDLLAITDKDEAMAAVDGASFVIVLASGTRQVGGDYHAYVALKPSRVEAYLQAHVNKTPIMLEDFGQILHWGEGLTPSAAVKAEMQKLYNIQDDWEEQAFGALTQIMSEEDIVAQLEELAKNHS